MHDTERLDTGLGDQSISSCLLSAMYGLPDEVRLIEIRYCGLHMGTFEKLELMYRAEAVAQTIMSEHGYFAKFSQ